MGDILRFPDGARAERGAIAAGDARSRALDPGGQHVVPGAERIGDRALAERRMTGRLAPRAPQRSLDFGLFDEAGAGRQRDLFADTGSGS